MTLDGFGQEVPYYLEKVFQAREQIEEQCREIDRVRHALQRMALDPGMRDVDMKEVDRLLRRAEVTLRLGSPLQRCDCVPGTLDCPYCNGAKWVSHRSLLSSRPLFTPPVSTQRASCYGLPICKVQSSGERV